MNDIERAINHIISRDSEMARLIDYYDGWHTIQLATDKYLTAFGEVLKGMRENLCQIVVDAPADRMEIINFSSGDDRSPIAARAWEIWQRELMELESSEVHRDAFKCGESYLIVWEGEPGMAAFYPQDSRQCAIIEDESTGKPLFAAKLWVLSESKKIRLTLYYADRIEKYITDDDYRQGSTKVIKAESFVPYASEDESEAVVANPYGVIPVFKFKAEKILRNVIPVQDRLNKTICDELVAQEFGAYPQRFATGLEPPVNEATGRPELPFKAGLDRLWFTNDSEVKFGQFQSADLTQFLKVEDAARLSIARVTGTPLHFFSFSTSDALSGEALKTLESRFTKRIKRTALAFGAVWSRAMTLALVIEGAPVDTSLTVQWESPEQRSESEFVDTLVKKIQLGVPLEVLQQEYGYTEEDVTIFKTLKAAEPPTDAAADGQSM